MAGPVTGTLGPPPAATKKKGRPQPLGVTAEDQLKVSGIGDVFGLPWGVVTVGTAITGFEDLARAANGKGPQAAAAQKSLAQIQQDMYLMGLYGTQQPTHGAIGTKDLAAVRKALIGAATSGQRFGDYLNTQSANSQAAGTAGADTHIIPAQHVAEQVWSPDNIRAVIDAAGSATGQNIAQKLIGRDFSQSELTAIANSMNASSASVAGAQAAGDLATQQQDISVATGVYAGTGAAAGMVNPQQVATEIAHQGGNLQQQQIGAALVSGIESNGDPTVLAKDANGRVDPGMAAGLFQFQPGTWLSNGGGRFAPNAQSATWQQQVTVFINATKGGNYYPWKPDLVPGGSYDGRPIGGAQPGSKVARYLAQSKLALGATQDTAALTRNASAASPVGRGLKQGRVDQGVDWSGRGPLYAVGAGTIVSLTNSGWPGGTFIGLRLDNPPDPQHSLVYYAEDITPNVRIGDHVGAGRQIGMATGGPSGIEIGWGNPNAVGQPLAQVSNIAIPLNLARQLPESDRQAATGQGAHFLNFIQGASMQGTDWAAIKQAVAEGGGPYLAAGAISGEAPGGARGQITNVYQNPVIDQVPVQLSPQEAATQFAETQMAPQFQTNNLLRMFQMIQTKLASPDPSLNANVRRTPVVMK